MGNQNVKYLLTLVGPDVGKPFCLAAQFGDVNMLTMFRGLGANLSYDDGEFVGNALEHAARYKIHLNVEYLPTLVGRADIGKALCVAARFGDVNMLTMFRGLGANLSYDDGEFVGNALEHAARYNRNKNVEYLLTLVGPDFGKAFCYAARFGNVDMLTMFVNRLADSSFSDWEFVGNALEQAAMYNRNLNVKYLMSVLGPVPQVPC